MIAGCATSPRAQKKPSHRQHPQKQQGKYRWSRVLTAAFFIAWAILGVCFLMGTWLPHHSADLAQGVQSSAATWRILSMLRSGTPRHLLEVLLSVCLSPRHMTPSTISVLFLDNSIYRVLSMR